MFYSYFPGTYPLVFCSYLTRISIISHSYLTCTLLVLHSCVTRISVSQLYLTRISRLLVTRTSLVSHSFLTRTSLVSYSYTTRASLVSHSYLTRTSLVPHMPTSLITHSYFMHITLNVITTSDMTAALMYMSRSIVSTGTYLIDRLSKSLNLSSNFDLSCDIKCKFMWDGFGRWLGRNWKPYLRGKSNNCSKNQLSLSLSLRQTPRRYHVQPAVHF